MEEGGELVKDRGAVAVLLAVLFLGVGRDAFVLLRYPVAVGIDGYYYVLQVHELLARGQLYFPTDTPLVFYVLAALAALAGDTVLAIKIGSIALNLALCAGLYALVSYSTRSRWLGVLAGLIAAVSAMHFYMVAEFIKNLCALALLVWCWWAAVRAGRDRRVRWTMTAAVLFIAAVCSHRSAWALASAIFTFGVLLRPLFTKDYLNSRKVPALLAAIFLAISPALVAAQPFMGLPEWVAREVLARPQWPVHLGSPFGTLEMTALLVAAPLTLLFLRRLPGIPPTPHFAPIMGGVALWSLLITLNPFLNHDVRQLGIVGRLDHLMYVQLGILIPGLTWLTSYLQRKSLVVLLPLTALFLVTSWLSPLPKGLRQQYISNRSQMIGALPEHRQQLGLNPLVIAQHGDEFVVTWALGLPAQQRLPDDTNGHTVYWLLHHVRQSDLTNSMIVVVEEEDDLCLVLIRHEELAHWLSTMTEAEQKQLLTYNPQLEGRLPPGSHAAAR